LAYLAAMSPAAAAAASGSGNSITKLISCLDGALPTDARPLENPTMKPCAAAAGTGAGKTMPNALASLIVTITIGCGQRWVDLVGQDHVVGHPVTLEHSAVER
jgi:hypothetical protein